MQVMERTGSRHLRITECSRILPSTGSSGMSSKWRPSAVISSEVSRAPMVFSVSTAALVTRAEGGSETSVKSTNTKSYSVTITREFGQEI